MNAKPSHRFTIGFVLFWGLIAIILPSEGFAQSLPKVISIGCPSVGTAMHGQALAIAQFISERTPMQARIEPGEFLVGVDLLRKGEVEFNVNPMATVTMAIMGWAPFDKPQWGPQSIRTVWMGSPVASMTPCVLGNSEILKYPDLKGKKIPSVLTSPALDRMTDAWLEYGGLTRKDVITVKFADSQKAYDAILERTVDMTICPPGSPSAYKIAASPFGIRYLGCPHKDKRYWEIMRKHAPWCVPLVIYNGAGGISKENPLESSAMHCAMIASAETKEEIVYNVVKALDTGNEKLVTLHKDLQGWSLSRATDLQMLKETIFVYHPGAIKYFKEMGKWTSAHDGWRNEMLALEAKRMAEFKAKQKK